MAQCRMCQTAIGFGVMLEYYIVVVCLLWSEFTVIHSRFSYRMIDSINNDQINSNGMILPLKMHTWLMTAYAFHMHYHRRRRMKWINRLFALVNSDIEFYQCALDNTHLVLFSSLSIRFCFPERGKKLIRSPIEMLLAGFQFQTPTNNVILIETDILHR